MIDLHNHILPGVDDGAVDLRESVDIARKFEAEGVETVVATPHLDPELGNGVGAEVVDRLVPQVQEAIDAAGIKLRVLPGNELYLTLQAPDLIGQGTVMTLARGPYVLVEVSFDQRPLYLDDVLFRIQNLGYQPILAHPERYQFVHRDLESATALASRDVILQLTAPSLLGEYGPEVQRVATRLLRRGLYSLAASDRHHARQNRSLEALRNHISRVTNADTASLLLERNPRAVVEGGTVESPEVSESDSRPFWRRVLG